MTISVSCQASILPFRVRVIRGGPELCLEGVDPLAQEYLPEEIAGRRFYEPGGTGFEKRTAERMEFWAKMKAGGKVVGRQGGRSGGSL